MSLQNIDINFSGNLRTVRGDIKMESVADAVKKGLIACAVIWLLAVCSTIVPFIQWTAPFIFLFLGPLVGFAVYYFDLKEVRSFDSNAVCAACNTNFKIHEAHFRPPFYGDCPQCKTSYRVDFKPERTKVMQRWKARADS